MPKYVVRYGAMRFLGVFSTRGNDRWDRTARVIARTNRGLEVGEILCEATDAAVQQLQEPNYGQILRGMTAEDANELNHIQSREPEEVRICQRIVEQLGLQMQLVDIEHLFGGERIVVYYLAEQRVDFRELVKLLAGEFQTRIEMRQIGVRDEAKLLADYGDCGKPVCCNTHLVADAAGVDEDGQAAEGDARSDQDFRTLRTAEMLPAIRVRHVRGTPTGVTGGGDHRHDASRTSSGTDPGNPGQAVAGGDRRQPQAAHPCYRGTHCQLVTVEF